MQHFNYLIEHYGYVGIFIALVGGIIGLPLPDEVLLTFVGYNVYLGRMSLLPSILFALIGTCVGISLSYFLGMQLGLPFLSKFGPKIHITEPRIVKTKKLYSKLGPYLLIIGYFIPGVRHITAYLAGINSYSIKKFSLFAFAGAALWCITFITLGSFLGPQWKIVHDYVSKYGTYIFALGIFFVVIVSIIFWQKRGGQKKNHLQRT
ncbi:DedA family protein [Bacillus salipaludis]|uniref:DedA family protein n=1 Tax=Bacillus salipaludis TaxID=2547811 RepID=A0AA90ZAJ4_9BACI|nr:DedA family protein [Bacillus salipaludis]MDQ6601060.1 DedA family protein [Bacillus salipaludis]